MFPRIRLLFHSVEASADAAAVVVVVVAAAPADYAVVADFDLTAVEPLDLEFGNFGMPGKQSDSTKEPVVSVELAALDQEEVRRGSSSLSAEVQADVAK